MANVVLDAGPVGLLCDPRPRPDPLACRAWANDLLTAGHRVFVAEIADYEVRRELLRANRARSVAELDLLLLPTWLEYLPITTAALRRAAELWAAARQTGRQTAGDASLDADMILVALAESLNDPNTVIATTNVGHLGQFFPAVLWHTLVP